MAARIFVMKADGSPTSRLTSAIVTVDSKGEKKLTVARDNDSSPAWRPVSG